MTEAVTEEENLNEIQGNALKSSFFLYIVAALIFVLPVKFGSTWMTGDQSAFPMGIAWIIGSWPQYFLTILSSLLLIASIIIYRPSSISKEAGFAFLSWVLICVAIACFGYDKNNVSFYYYSINQALTVAIFILLIAICIEGDKRSRTLFTMAACGGLLFTVLAGLYQFFWGFQETQALVESQMQNGGQVASGVMSRVKQSLVFSTFTISNSFAGHILLVLPLMVYMAVKKFNKENPLVQNIFGVALLLFGLFSCYSSGNLLLGIISTTLGVITLRYREELPEIFYKYLGLALVCTTVIVLFMTRSRAGIVSLFAGALFSGIFCAKGKTRSLCITLFAAGIVGAIFYAPTVGSFQVRLGYYKALLAMFQEQPMGYGFGSFSEVYNQVKGAGIEESNIPHSFFMGYLGQGGIFCGLAVILSFCLTFFTVLKSTCSALLKYCLLCGFSCWFIHAQFDFHVMVPGTLALLGVICLFNDRDLKPSENSRNYSILFSACIPLLLTVVYFNFINARGELRFSRLSDRLIDPEINMSIDEVRDRLEKINTDIPYSNSPYGQVHGWAFKRYMNSPGGDILRHEFLKLAKETVEKAISITPRRSSLYTNSAGIYFYMRNYEKTLEMLEKSFELYPFSPSALSTERSILLEYLRREPQNERVRYKYLVNMLKMIEIKLGRFKFGDHLGYSPNQLKSIYLDLDKAASRLYNDLEFLKNAGVKMDLSGLTSRLDEIVREAKILAGLSTQ